MKLVEDFPGVLIMYWWGPMKRDGVVQLFKHESGHEYGSKMVERCSHFVGR